jgi:hypothetical protein
MRIAVQGIGSRGVRIYGKLPSSALINPAWSLLANGKVCLPGFI